MEDELKREIEIRTMKMIRDYSKIKNKERYCCSRCIALSENAISFDAELHRYYDPDYCRKANIVITRNLKVSLSYPFDGKIFVREEEIELINHCIERAKVIFSN